MRIDINSQGHETLIVDGVRFTEDYLKSLISAMKLQKAVKFTMTKGKAILEEIDSALAKNSPAYIEIEAEVIQENTLLEKE